MRLAVAGGTGLVGRLVVEEARRRGHAVSVLSRSTGVDVVEGSGLGAALDGIEIVVDVLNPPPGADPRTFFETAARRISEAAARAGVRRVVVLSIVGLERTRDYPYYAAKLAQEAAYAAGPAPASVVRATQFHEFPRVLIDRQPPGPFVFVTRMRVRSIAASAVAGVLVDAAESTDAPARAPLEIAGPDVADMTDLVRRILRRRGSRRLVLARAAPGPAGRPMASGGLLPGPDAAILGPSFDAWLDAQP